MLASDWQNPFVPNDVDADGVAEPQDVLICINDINGRRYSSRDGQLPDRALHPQAPWLDVNGDGELHPIDVLAVINALNGDSAPPTVAAGLNVDTGPLGTTNQDSLTKNPTVSGRAVDVTGIAGLTFTVDGGSPATAAVSWDGTFAFDPGMPRDGTADGEHRVVVWASDARGNVSAPVELVFQLDTVPPAEVQFDLSAGSDTGVAGDGITTARRVTLVGRTEAGAQLRLLERNLDALASLRGGFQAPGVELQVGANPLTVIAADLAGNERQSQATLTRDVAAEGADPVLTWNQIVLDVIRLDATVPPVASRNLAMVHAAVYDAVSAIEGTPGLYAALDAPPGSSAEAAVGAAAHRVLVYAYPAQQTALDAALTTFLTGVPDGASETEGAAVGRAAAEAMIALRARDGWDDFEPYAGGDQPGVWRPTLPMFAPALLPQWATLEPFLMTRPDQFRPAGPPDLGSSAYAAALNEVQLLGRADSTSRTAEQTQIARFWADNPGTYTPPGHWNQIAAQIARETGNSLADNARLFAQLNVTLADSSIVAWDAKFAHEFWRPVTAIPSAADDGNPATTADANWTPLLVTPAFPEYVSGHSTYSGAAAAVLTAAFGDSVSFTTGSIGLPGVERTFASFQAAAEEAGRSRIYGGIHFGFANQDGLNAGRNLAADVLDAFSVSTDVRAPVVLIDAEPGLVTPQNVTLAGRVLDNLSGVAGLEFSLDGGAAAPLAFDVSGLFSLPTALALDGSDDGPHTVVWQARDAAGNTAQTAFAFTLDTRLPTVTLEAPGEGGTLADGAELSGTADGTGSALAALSHRWDGGTSRPLIVSPDSGGFRTALDLSQMAPGDHVLTVTARDAAGHTATVTRHVNLPARVPFQIASHVPSAGATEVGVTFRPRIDFTRPVEASTLNSLDFFASDAAGNRLPATIVPATGGAFAWLFFRNPLPGASQVTVTVDGAGILAADGAVLDADGDGTPGGPFQFSFTTVSRTDLPNTSIAGILADPGPDLKPGTPDDVRAGADGVLMTADDVYLLPIEGAKIYILGREDQALFTGADGYFELTSVPAGNVKLVTDGLTAANAPAGFYFPEMVMDLQIQPGEVNHVMQAMEPDPIQAAMMHEVGVYLPRLRTSLLQAVDADETTVLGVDAESAPNLTPEQRTLLTLEIQPDSLIGADGLPLTNGQVGISTVPPELVRDMLPPGVLEHTFDITIQAPGISNFSAPAPMTFPNIFHAAPGTKLNLLSFDHTTGRLVIEGTATVSPDGRSVTTDPDTGITHPGWHGLTPPGADACSAGAPPLPSLPKPGERVTEHLPERLPFITGETGDLLHLDLLWLAPPGPPPKDPPPGGGQCAPVRDPVEEDKKEKLTVYIEVDGPLSTFMKKSGSLDLVSQSFTLLAGSGKVERFWGEAKTYAELFEGRFRELFRDVLYGSKIKVTEIRTKADGSVERDIRTFLLYRWIDVVDAGQAKDKTGDTAVFLRTSADGAGGFVRTKNVWLRIPGGIDTTFAGSGTKPFDYGPAVRGAGEAEWKFDPAAADVSTAADGTYQSLTDSVSITAKVPFKGGISNLQVGEVQATGKAVGKTIVSVDASGFAAHFVTVIQALRKSAAGNIFYRFADNTTTRVSAKFAAEFAGFMPDDRNPDGSWKGGDLAARATAVANALFDEVKKDFSSLASVITVQKENAGANVRTAWGDKGPGLNGNADRYDYDVAAFQALVGTRGRTDPVTRNTYNLDISEAAQQWVLSDLINERLTNSGDYGITNKMNYTGTITLAQNVANTVSHEIAHTLGLNEAYLNAALPAGAGPHGTAACKQVNPGENGGICKPYGDLMNNSRPTDVKREFKPVTLGLLRAAVGLAPNGEMPLVEELKLWRDNFYLHVFFKNINGLDDEGDPAVSPEIALQYVDGEFYGLADESYEVAPVAADGAGGNLASFQFDVVNWGVAPLNIASLTLADGSRGFSIVNAAALSGQTLDPQQSLTLELLFDPLTAGEMLDTLQIVSTAGIAPDFQLTLRGTALADRPTAELRLGGPDVAAAPGVEPVTTDVPTNNVGGVPVTGAEGQLDELATVTNTGTRPLTISAIREAEGAGRFRLLGLPPDLDTVPITLAPQAAFTFGVAFDPVQAGLDRALIEIVTDDPLQPLQRISAVGTGLPEIVYPEWGNDHVAVEVAGNTLRTVSNAAGNFQLFLPAEADYHEVVFDRVTGLISHSYGVTPPSGTGLDLTASLVFAASVEPDSDFDGLPDDVEFAIGTATRRSDTDADGLDDFVEIRLGQDPLGGRGWPLGIIAALALDGEAQEVVVDSPPGSDQQLAYLATGSYGLAIVDVSQPDQPTLLGRVNLLGENNDVALDLARGLAAVAGDDAGLHLVQVGDPARPELLRTIPLLHGAQRVEIYDGVAYVASGRELVSIDVSAQDVLQTLDLGANLVDLAREGGVLYAVDQTGRLHAVDISGAEMEARGWLDTPAAGGRLFVGGGAALIGIGDRFAQGFVTVDVSDADDLQLISGPDDGSLVGQAVVNAGSGVGVSVGGIAGPGGQPLNRLDVLNLRDLTDTGALITGYNLPQVPSGVTVGGGVAFVADGNGGLQIVNYLGFDTLGQPPEVTLSSPAADVDSGQGGVQVVEGTSILLRAEAIDDVQVSSVELVSGGTVVATDLTFPFEFLVIAPLVAAGNATLEVQVRAYDTGGNQTSSNALVFESVPDTILPSVLSSSPAEGQRRLRVSAVSLRFDEALDPAAVTPAGVTLTHLGADGAWGGGDDSPAPVATVTVTSTRRLSVVPDGDLTPGNYRLVVDPLTVADLAGNHPVAAFTLNFHKRPPTTPIAAGDAVQGELFAIDEREIYTFAGAVGQRLIFDGWEGGDNLRAKLTSPSGLDVSTWNGTVAGDRAPFTLGETGQYSLTVFADWGFPGPFAFQLLDVAAQPALPRDTTVGVGLVPVPPLAWTALTGSYVNADLGGIPGLSDWRITQPISGSRGEGSINYTTNSWGPRAPLGLTGGSDGNWDFFSVQWDGTVAVPADGTHLYLRTQNGGRMWIDVNRDGVFADTGDELVDNRFGEYGPEFTSRASSGLAPGLYPVRIQMHHSLFANRAQLLWDGGVNVSPGTSQSVYHLDGVEGQRLFFDSLSLYPPDFWGDWSLYGPTNDFLSGARLHNDFQVTLPADGRYVLALTGYDPAQPAAYQFRVLTPETTVTPLTYNSLVSGTLGEPGEIHEFTWSGVAGQRLWYDAWDNADGRLSVQVFSPSGERIQAGDARGDLELFTLLETGSYRLTISGNGDALGDYGFRLLNVADQPVLALDATYDTGVALTPGTATQLYRFDGLADQRLFLDSLGMVPPGASAQWLLLGPGDQLVSSGWLNQDLEPTLTAVGQYVLVVRGFSADADVEYAFRAVTPDRTTTALTLGADVSSSVSEPGEVDVFTFAGAAGQTLFFDSLRDTGTALNAALVSPSGLRRPLLGSLYDSGPLALRETGTYQLELDGSGDVVGDYDFRLLDADAAPLLTLDASLTGTLAPDLRTELFRLAGTEDRRLYLDFHQAFDCGGLWRLYSPDESALRSVCFGTEFDVTLPATGTYFVTQENNGSATAEPFDWTLEETADGTLAWPGFGGRADSDVPEPGDRREVTLPGSAGQQIYYDALATSSDAIRVTLLDPTGATVFSGDADSDAGPLTLTGAGSYMLVFAGEEDATGDFAFQVLDLAGAAALTLGTAVAGSIDSGRETVQYHFAAAAGDRVSLSSVSASRNDAQWRLIGPALEDVTGTVGIDISPGAKTLSLAGDYTLLISGTFDDATPLDFEVLVSDVSDAAVTPSGFGVEHAGVLAGGAEDVFGYDAPAGSRVLFDSLDSDFDAVTVELRDPNDDVVLASWSSASGDHGPLVLPRGGTYHLKLIGNSGGDYRFRLLNLADATPLAFATTYSSASLPGFQTDIYSWTGSAGRLAFYDGLDLDFETVTVKVLDPNLETVDSFPHYSGLESLALAESGPYYLLVSNGAGTAGDYAFRLLNLADQPALTLADVTSGTLDPGSRGDVFRLTGAAGQRLFLQGEDQVTCAAYWNVYRGDTGAWLASSCLHGDQEVTLPYEGTFAVTLEGNSDGATVPYAFRAFRNETVSGPLAGFDTEISGTIADPGDRREYVFSGTGGQRIYYDALDADGDAVSVTIYRPDGLSLHSGSAEWDSSLLTLPQTGDYRVVLDGDGRGTGDFRFQLLDAASADALSLDTFISDSLAEDGQTRLYRFVGSADQLLYFDAQGNGNTNAYWTLYRADGGVLASTVVASDFEVTLPAAGSYVLAVNGQASPAPALLRLAAGGGSLGYHFRVVTPDTDTAPLTLGGVYGGSFFFTQPQPGWSAPANAAFGSDGDLYVVSSDGVVDRYEGDTGTWRDRFIAASGVFGPSGMIFGPDGDLYLADRFQNIVFKFNGASGASLGAFVSAGSGGLSQPGGLAFGPDGDLYVSSAGTDSVLRYDGTTGAFVGEFVAAGSGGLDGPRQLRFGPDGRLYVSSFDSQSVLRYDGTTGAFVDVFVPAGYGGLWNPSGLAFSTGGDLLVSSWLTGVVLRYSGSTGDFLGDFVSGGGLSYPEDLLLRPDGGVYAVSSGSRAVLRFDGTSGGCTVDEMLCEAGERDEFTFVGTAGQLLYYDALMPPAGFAGHDLIRPSGLSEAALGTPASFDTGPFRLSETGDYRLAFSAQDGRNEGYRFRLLNAADAPAAALDTTLSGSLDPWQMHTYQFRGLADQRLFVSTTGGASCDAQIAVAGPNGVELGSTCVGSFFELTLPSDGTYFVRVSNGLGFTTPYSFRIGTPTASVTPIPDLNADVLGTISEPGEVDAWTFAGSIGQRLVPDLVELADTDFAARLVSPSGAIVGTMSPWDDGAPLTLLESGTYRFEVDPWGAAAGDYLFRLIDLAAAPELPMNEAFTETLTPGTRAHVYRFEGVANQEISFTATGPAFCNAAMTLWGPGNQSLGSDCVSGDFQAVLPAGGTYTLAVVGYDFLAPVTYSLQANTSALLAAAAPATVHSDALEAPSLTDAALAALWDEALRRWSLAGVGDGALRTATAGVRLSIDDLPDGYLGLVTRGNVHLDRDAAGHGWFVDDTPWDDREFDFLADHSDDQARADGPAAGRVDLLTVVMHELGHLLGFEHNAGDAGSVLSELLPTGGRRTPSWQGARR